MRYDRRLYQLALRGELVVLAGAGVSTAAPSLLPAGVAWRDLLLEALLSRTRTLLSSSERRRIAEASRTLTPERFFLAVIAAAGRAHVVPAFHTFLVAVPNANHRALATLVGSDGPPLFTTNFDDLIERASATSGRKIHIVHLHGRLTRRSSPRISANQTFAALGRRARRELRSAATCRHLFVVGYSGADPDVMRALQRLSWRSVTWLYRSRRPTLGTWRSTSVTWWRANLNNALPSIARVPRAPLGKERVARTVRRAVRKWAESLPSAVATFALIRTALEAERLSCVEPFIERTWRAMARMRESGSAEAAARLANDVAFSYYEAGEFARVASWARRGLRLALRERELYAAACCANMLGLRELELADVERRPRHRMRAREDFRSALQLLSRIHSMDLDRQRRKELHRGVVLNNLGLLDMRAALELADRGEHTNQMRRYAQRAEGMFVRAAALKRRLGELRSASLSDANRVVLLARTGSLARVARATDRVFARLVELDPWQASYAAREVAVAYRQARQLDTATAWFARSRAALPQGDPYSRALIDWNLAMTMYLRGEHADAMRLRRSAERVLERLHKSRAVEHESDWSRLR